MASRLVASDVWQLLGIVFLRQEGDRLEGDEQQQVGAFLRVLRSRIIRHVYKHTFLIVK